MVIDINFDYLNDYLTFLKYIVQHAISMQLDLWRSMKFISSDEENQSVSSYYSQEEDLQDSILSIHSRVSIVIIEDLLCEWN